MFTSVRESKEPLQPSSARKETRDGDIGIE